MYVCVCVRKMDENEGEREIVGGEELVRHCYVPSTKERERERQCEKGHTHTPQAGVAECATHTTRCSLAFVHAFSVVGLMAVVLACFSLSLIHFPVLHMFCRHHNAAPSLTLLVCMCVCD